MSAPIRDGKIPVGIVGATGMVGQRFVTLLAAHPYFEITALFAGPHSAGKTYAEAVRGRWVMSVPIPENVTRMPVCAVDPTIAAAKCRLVFSAFAADRVTVAATEEALARAGLAVVSNNAAHRATPDVPMIIPEVNPEHLAVIPAQRRRLGGAGFIVVKPNCSIQSYTAALAPLMSFRPTEVSVTSMQAASGAGKTLADWRELSDNIIPFIDGEEAKSETEPLKIFGKVASDRILPSPVPCVSAQCVRVPLSDGHLAAVRVHFAKEPTREQILAAWDAFDPLPERLRLPSAPDRFLVYREEPDSPQPAAERDTGMGMSVILGRLFPDPLGGFRFFAFAHNTLRGAAGGAVLTAELLVSSGYVS